MRKGLAGSTGGGTGGGLGSTGLKALANGSTCGAFPNGEGALDGADVPLVEEVTPCAGENGLWCGKWPLPFPLVCPAAP